MRQLDFARIVAKRNNMNIKTTNKILVSIFEEISNTLEMWEDVSIIWFGKFSTLVVQQRRWVKPWTKEKIIIPKLTRFKFFPSKILKGKINKPWKE